MIYTLKPKNANNRNIASESNRDLMDAILTLIKMLEKVFQNWGVLSGKRMDLNYINIVLRCLLYGMEILWRSEQKWELGKISEFRWPSEIDPFRLFLAMTLNQNESNSNFRVLPNLEPTNMIRLMFRYLLTNSSTCLISVYSTNTINLKCYTTGMSRLNILYRGKKYEVSVSFWIFLRSSL